MIGVGIGCGVSGFRLPSSGFTPATISGLKLWLDSSDAATVYQSNGGALAAADGDPVGYWIDKSGQGNHATQASGTNKPAFRTNIKNGKPIIRFDGTNDNMTLPSAILANSSISFFIVWSPSILVGTATTSSYVVAGNNYGMRLSNFGGALTNERITFMSEALADALPAYGECTENIAVAFHLMAMTYNRANLAEPLYWRNGTSKTLTSTGTTASVDWETVGNFCLKYIGNFTANFQQKDIAEIIAYDSSLSTTDRQKVETYLNAKWAIY